MQINKRQTELAFPYCSLVWDPVAVLEANSTSEFTLKLADRIFTVWPLLVSLNLLTFIVYIMMLRSWRNWLCLFGKK